MYPLSYLHEQEIILIPHRPRAESARAPPRDVQLACDDESDSSSTASSRNPFERSSVEVDRHRVITIEIFLGAREHQLSLVTAAVVRSYSPRITRISKEDILLSQQSLEEEAYDLSARDSSKCVRCRRTCVRGEQPSEWPLHRLSTQTR